MLGYLGRLLALLNIDWPRCCRSSAFHALLGLPPKKLKELEGKMSHSCDLDAAGDGLMCSLPSSFCLDLLRSPKTDFRT